MITRGDLEKCKLLRMDGVVRTVTSSAPISDGEQQAGSLLWHLRCNGPAEGAPKDLVLCCSCQDDDERDPQEPSRDGAWDRVVAVEVDTEPKDVAPLNEGKSVRFGGAERAPVDAPGRVQVRMFAPNPCTYSRVRASALGDITLPAHCIELAA